MSEAQESPKTPALERGGRDVRPRGWLSLLAGLAGLLFIVWVGLPWLHRAAGLEESVRIIHEREIEAGAIYYNTVDQVSRAESLVRGAMTEP